MKKTAVLLTLMLLFSKIGSVSAQSRQPEFSTAGFFQLEGTGRKAYSMNPAWRIHKGAAQDAQLPDYNDKDWALTALPDGIELLPAEASGCVNYQDEVWYRKHFTPDSAWQGKRLFLHFEAIMGHSRVWINGRLVKEHFGGYLPVIADITPYLNYGKDNVIAVWADNQDCPLYPPGKQQDMLDFAYFGGIYRDCWLIVHNQVFLTDPNNEQETAGGGLFVSFDRVSEKSADIRLDAHLRNASDKRFAGKIVFELYDRDNRLAGTAEKTIHIRPEESTKTTTEIQLARPELWSPDHPYLYQLHVLVKNRSGKIIDGYRRRIGVRSIEFKGQDGFWLNGKPYPYPLIGANRHQDFAVIGNALSNSLHWRDAKKLRDAGLRVIRNAHYPQDPAFMDACDELGLFVIVNTPGWQFWNNDPVFAARVYDDIRNMVRRDRNHPSVWLWEPILNETWYPDDFARRAADIIREEYPYPYCYSGCDVTARGHEFFPVHFTHPLNGGGGAFNTSELDPKITYFTREWGDNVDDWNSHNSPSRVSRRWGEIPMLIQAQGYACTDYQLTNYDVLWRTPRQHVGGCLWHSFDHQRGYHPDPFYGGIMDAFRQPKTSYYMFCAQRPARKDSMLIAENGPMVYIAHAMTPFSPEDVTVYSNCEEVRLTCGTNGKQYTYKKDTASGGMPAPVITFKQVWNVMQDKKLARNRQHAASYMLAEGIIDGKVVATHKIMPARRPTQIRLRADDEQVVMQADGSDLLTVIAAITDDQGNIKRLNNSCIRFELEGPGILVGNEETGTNPRLTEWGTAPILIRATTEPGTIKVKAMLVKEGKHTAIPGELSIKTVKPVKELVADAEEVDQMYRHIRTGKQPANPKKHEKTASAYEQEIQNLQRQINQLKLKEVEQQQSDFE